VGRAVRTPKDVDGARHRQGHAAARPSEVDRRGLVGAAILWALGLHGTILMAIPGALICVVMLRQGRVIAERVPRRVRGSAITVQPVPLAVMGVIIGMMMLRAWTIAGVQTFLPTWYSELGYGRLMQSALVQSLPESEGCA
jgi:hypothetical protein